MSLTSILLLALGLAMDATAVAAARGMASATINARHVALVAVLFGGAQGLMPALGWWLGRSFGVYVQRWDHWIIFALLTALGLKMLRDARNSDECTDDNAATFDIKTLLLLALATSIDAFAVGITLPMLNAPFALSLITIAVVTAVLSAAGMLIGKHFGALLGPRLEVIGGLVLIGLGTKILIEHLTQG